MKIQLVLILVFLLPACTSEKSRKQDQLLEEVMTEQDQLLKEVMAIHDEAMLHMSKISRLRKEAEISSKELLADSIESNNEKAMELENTAIELEAANESMMVWMRSFSNNFEGMGDDEIIDYLKANKQEVEKVKETMVQALQNAELLFAE